MRPVLLLALAACAPKAPPPPPRSTRVTLPVTYQPISLTSLARPLPPAPEPCQVGSRQDGPVLTELVACGDRGVSRVMVLPAEAPAPSDMLRMGKEALAAPGEVLETFPISFPANQRSLDGHRIFRNTGSARVFAGLVVVHPEAPWPELLTCSGPQPVEGLEEWCAAAIQALVLPDDIGRMGAPAQ